MKPIVIFSVILVLILSFVAVKSPLLSDRYCKDYLIEHIDSVYQITSYDDNDKKFKMITTDLDYYTDATIVLSEDSIYYSVIFWGDRDSWKWKFKSDKFFSVDVVYNQYKDINIEKDTILINRLLKIDRFIE